MAPLLKCETDIFLQMEKLKLLFTLVFLLAIQQVCFAQYNEQNFPPQSSHEIKISFEVNDFIPSMYGDVTSGQLTSNFVSEATNCHPGNSKSKITQSGLNYSVTKTNLICSVIESTVFTRQCTVFVPIYIQAASFLL